MADHLAALATTAAAAAPLPAVGDGGTPTNTPEPSPLSSRTRRGRKRKSSADHPGVDNDDDVINDNNNHLNGGGGIDDDDAASNVAYCYRISYRYGSPIGSNLDGIVANVVFDICRRGAPTSRGIGSESRLPLVAVAGGGGGGAISVFSSILVIAFTTCFAAITLTLTLGRYGGGRTDRPRGGIGGRGGSSSNCASRSVALEEDRWDMEYWWTIWSPGKQLRWREDRDAATVDERIGTRRRLTASGIGSSIGG